ncbi:hypothetical protein LOAG_17076 [Loa loa]|uniref:Uncharacterized protein n=1 Tax=Loa loa TaxID=7209 RepID=A0A1S0UM50_LOALO|nr:hypothetical protein LOAG_17076 [Loa loa]EJD75864.1 hypothetical protein LOAG_17076 [Loa loa]
MNAVLQGLFHVEAFKALLNIVPESSQGTILSALKALRKNYQKATNAKKRCLLENVFKFLDDERFEMSEQEAAYSIFDLQKKKIQTMIFRMLGFGEAEEEEGNISGNSQQYLSLKECIAGCTGVFNHYTG